MIWAEAWASAEAEEPREHSGAGSKRGVIGRDGKMPWHLPEDLAFFKANTMGCPVIMGRRTWETLDEKFRPLPGRENIVVTRDAAFVAPGATVASSVQDAISKALDFGPQTIWIMGGGQIYRAAMEFADELVVTRIDLEVPDADTFAPTIDTDQWELAEPGQQHTSAKGLRYRFERWVRG